MPDKSNGLHGEDTATFEESFARLQEMVQKLSQGNLALQDALASFEEGMRLAERCTQMLDAAELRLSQVSALAGRAGAESLGGLEELVLRSQVGREDEEAGGVASLEAIEIESVETHLFVDTSRGGGTNITNSRSQEKGRTSDTQRSATARESSQSPPAHVELDPLFDEED
jgi:exodeoxyribonuclease VII small subunit